MPSIPCQRCGAVLPYGTPYHVCPSGSAIAPVWAWLAVAAIVAAMMALWPDGAA